MTPKTLKQIKERISLFFPLVQSLANYFEDFPLYTLLNVLVQNAAHDASDCQNYSHEKAVERLYEIEKLLYKIKEYEKSYLEQYIYDEISTIIMGCTMSADIESEDEIDIPDCILGGFETNQEIRE